MFIMADSIVNFYFQNGIPELITVLAHMNQNDFYYNFAFWLGDRRTVRLLFNDREVPFRDITDLRNLATGGISINYCLLKKTKFFKSVSDLRCIRILNLNLKRFRMGKLI